MIELKIIKQMGNFALDVDIKSENKILGILGESGSGKSMILKSIAGLIEPDRGYIKIKNKYFDSSKNFSMKTEERKVGYLFQSYALFPNMTAENNIYFVCKDMDKTRDLLKRVGLYDKKNLYPRSLSGGQRQRLAMARMLSLNPELILLDEPFSALDSSMRDEMEKFIKDLISHYDIPTILVSHNKEEVYRLCQDILIIKDGKIEDVGSKDRVFFQPKNKYSAKLVGFDIFLDKEDQKDLILKEDVDSYIGLKSKDIKIIKGENFLVESKDEELEIYSYKLSNKKTKRKIFIKSNQDLKVGQGVDLEVSKFVEIKS